jgi:hypothetical protein
MTSHSDDPNPSSSVPASGASEPATPAAAPPTSEPVTPVAPPPASEGTTAEQYIAAELQRAKASLHMTRIGGVVFLVIVGGYLLFITNHFRESLQPSVAAEIAEGMINQQVEDRGPDLAAQLKQKIPEYIAQTPDYALEQLPKYRAALEDRIEAKLTAYSQATSQQLGQHLDSYLEQHKEEIRGMLTAASDPATTKTVGESLKTELMSYINEKPASGESIGEQINQSLASLQQIGKTVHRLAEGKNLSAEEKKTRHVIAILSQSIDNQKSLPRMP